MTLPADKLAQSLAFLSELQEKGIIAIQTKNLPRTHRERLLQSGFIQEVMKGWYIPARPDEPTGDSTTWYVAFWDFCAAYLTERFGNDWCLTAEQSLSLQSGDWTVPKQLLVHSLKGRNRPTELLHGTSIFDLRLKLPDEQNIEEKQGLRLMKLPAALIHCSPHHFVEHPTEMRAALSMISDASDVLHQLLTGGHSKVAGRLAGAFRNIGREQIADDILKTMRAASYKVTEQDPFVHNSAISFSSRETSPYVNRLRLNWQNMRTTIIDHFPPAPGLPTNATTYLKQVEDIYVTDAYHSLSIEGYRVSVELIERVKSGNWNPATNSKDRQQQDTLAARGYWQAFQSVKNSIARVLNNENPGEVIAQEHRDWYQKLFAPSVTAGIIQPADLAGYRNKPVYIRRSKHVPPNYEAVRELMPAFMELLQNETEPAVRVVLGHFIFVYIHPYVDGNGRMGRFLMNVMLAAGGYSWTVVPVENRDAYMAALEAASVEHDILPFTRFLAGLVKY